MLIESPVTVVIGDVKTKDEIKIPELLAVVAKNIFFTGPQPEPEAENVTIFDNAL